jgi:hypothetical protein
MAHGTYNGPAIQTNPGLLTHISHGRHRSHELHEAATYRREAATLGEATRQEAELSSGSGDRQKTAEQRRAAGRQLQGTSTARHQGPGLGLPLIHLIPCSLQILQFVCLHQIST